MKDSFTIKEISTSLQIPERTLQARAKREKWTFVEEVLPTGAKRRLYCVSVLLATEQARLVVNQMAPIAGAKPTPLSDAQREAERTARWDAYDRLPDKRKDKAKERLTILQEVEFLWLGGMPVDIAAQQVAHVRKIGISTIHLWRSRVAGKNKADWLAYLADQYTGRTVVVECPSEALDLIKADWLRIEAPRFTDCHRRLQRAANEQGWALPSEKTLYRRIQSQVHPAVIVMAREGAQAVRKMYPAQERDRSSLHAMEAVNTDGHTWDVWVLWPDGDVSRPCMIGFQDLYSGKILSWRIDKTENTWSVRLAFGDMVEQYGIPKSCYFDNGRSFASKWLTGGVPNRYRFKVKDEEPIGIVTQMGVDIHWTTPYSGQSKPIERAWGDFAQNIAKHPAFAGAYTGNSPVTKPENYRSKAVPLEDFMKVVASEIAEHNARPGRRAAVCNGRSFDQVFEESVATNPVTKCSDAQRRLWLLAAEGISVSGKDGAVKVMGNRYWAEWLHFHRGQKIVARFDPDALWDGLEIYSLNGVWLGHAECVEAAGFADADAAREHGRQRRRWLKAVKIMRDAEIRMSPDAVAAMVPFSTPADAPNGAVVALPRPVHDLRQTPVQTLTPEQQARREAMIHDFPQAPAAAPTPADEKRARIARAADIAARQARGLDVSETDAAWLIRYQTTPEYRAALAMQTLAEQTA